MTIRTTGLGGTDFIDSETIEAQDFDDTFASVLTYGYLGEVRMFALSISNAVTKAALQTAGWAICDGTTPAAQGITSPTITTTPDLQDKFISMSNDETSGTTGGAAAMAHTHTISANGNQASTSGGGAGYDLSCSATLTSSAASNTENRPPFYELVFFIKVKL